MRALQFSAVGDGASTVRLKIKLIVSREQQAAPLPAQLIVRALNIQHQIVRLRDVVGAVPYDDNSSQFRTKQDVLYLRQGLGGVEGVADLGGAS